MDPQGGPTAKTHRQRAMDLLTSNKNQDQTKADGYNVSQEQKDDMSVSIASELDDSEENGPRSAWSPDREDLEAYVGRKWPLASQRGYGRRKMLIGNFRASLRAIVLSSCGYS
jgi:hypothetical protein